ncbi:hypothetical protein OUZ56_010522 [Daphnia magna]|uniref:Uncharacterized protein n=1 Tax=Daphnia magna TaxID=35525 RepID=A0ABR0AIS7_9CRUS|nr:hypothetical protein OUZ56_010522 [Daphnia magna]
MFADGRTLWESLAAIQSTPASSDLSSSTVLLEGRHIRVSCNVGKQLLLSVHPVCTEPDSCIIRLKDGLFFRRMCRNINLDKSISNVFGMVRPAVFN